MPASKTFLYHWLPLFLYLSLIFLQSSFPSPETGLRIPHLDKGVHLVMYAILGVLFFRAYRNAWGHMNLRRLMLLGALSATLFGLSDEAHQYFVPYRTADGMDLLADFLGAALGVTVWGRMTGGEIRSDEIRD